MNIGAFLNRMIGANYFDLLRRWHRFTIEGREHLLSVGPAMIFSNHGRATPAHLYMLKALLAYEYGEPTYMFAPNVWFTLPYLRDAVEVAGFIPAEEKHVQRISDRGLKIIVTPGRHRESWGGRGGRYKLRWIGDESDERTLEDGITYVKWAIDRKLPIIPLAATGVDHSYYALWDAFRVWSNIKPQLAAQFPQYADLLEIPRTFTLPPLPWIGVGPLGVWPFTPPLPVRIKHYVGAPIRMKEIREKILHIGPGERIDGDHYAKILTEIQTRIQNLLNAAPELRTQPLFGDAPAPPPALPPPPALGAATKGPKLRVPGR